MSMPFERRREKDGGARKCAKYHCGEAERSAREDNKGEMSLSREVTNESEEAARHRQRRRSIEGCDGFDLMGGLHETRMGRCAILSG